MLRFTRHDKFVEMDGWNHERFASRGTTNLLKWTVWITTTSLHEARRLCWNGRLESRTLRFTRHDGFVVLDGWNHERFASRGTTVSDFRRCLC